jgi:hypothetical protein
LLLSAPGWLSVRSLAKDVVVAQSLPKAFNPGAVVRSPWNFLLSGFQEVAKRAPSLGLPKNRGACPGNRARLAGNLNLSGGVGQGAGVAVTSWRQCCFADRDIRLRTQTFHILEFMQCKTSEPLISKNNQDLCPAVSQHAENSNFDISGGRGGLLRVTYARRITTPLNPRGIRGERRSLWFSLFCL